MSGFFFQAEGGGRGAQQQKEKQLSFFAFLSDVSKGECQDGVVEDLGKVVKLTNEKQK